MSHAKPGPEPIDTPGTDPLRRPVRSFVLRAGRLGTGQARALADLGPRFLQPFQPALLDWDAAFGRAAPRVLEIGFGMGQDRKSVV